MFERNCEPTMMNVVNVIPNDSHVVDDDGWPWKNICTGSSWSTSG
jgi:hypothetical protein